jgi:hypothetical protein
LLKKYNKNVLRKHKKRIKEVKCMPVMSTATETSVRIVVQTGLDGKDNPILKNRTFNKVKPSATDEAVFAVAKALSDLQKDTLQGIERVGINSLVEA